MFEVRVGNSHEIHAGNKKASNYAGLITLPSAQKSWEFGPGADGETRTPTTFAATTSR